MDYDAAVLAARDPMLQEDWRVVRDRMGLGEPDTPTWLTAPRKTEDISSDYEIPEAWRDRLK